MKRIKMIVAYDGTNYNGWQEQPNGITIEGVLNRHLSALLKERIHVTGASRTDSGVHALCNVAVFDTCARMPGEKISYALNQRLPEDIRIRHSQEVPEDFHPRKTPSRKTYEYHIMNEEFPNPVRRLYSHFTYVPLDEELMRRGAFWLVGTHDFKSFCSVATSAETTVRTIHEIAVLKAENEITIRVSGNGFLYNMVRIIAGTLMEVGAGKYPPETIKDMLLALDRKAAGPTAPARGLMLKELEYLS